MESNALLSDIASRASALRRDIHAHPELAFNEHRTAGCVARELQRIGLDTFHGLAGTGVVGRLRCGSGNRSVGLRADMDALPVDEANTFLHRSRHAGCMHACGHDGHTAMLVGAAEALASTRRFDGTVYFIFQPAEEHEGGAQVMVAEGLFDRFPMDRVFGLHNWPGMPAGNFGVVDGPVMAGADRFEIVVDGCGGHAAMPHQATDTVVAGSALVQALQTVVSRNADPLQSLVVSVTRFHAGHADNVLPGRAILGGTVRTLRPAVKERAIAGMNRVCQGIAAAYGVKVDLHYEHGYPPTINDAAAAALCRASAVAVAGAGRVRADLPPSMGAEDFSYMLQAVPGCYVWLGNGAGEGGCMLHSPHYDFNDEIIATGIRYWVDLAERALPLGDGS